MSNSDFKNENITAEVKKTTSAVFRKCIACGKIVDRKNLIRILFEHKTQNIIINPSNKEFGKSKYICNNAECLKIALKKKRLKFLSEKNIEILKGKIE